MRVFVIKTSFIKLVNLFTSKFIRLVNLLPATNFLNSCLPMQSPCPSQFSDFEFKNLKI